MATHKDFRQSDWERIERDWTDWWDGELGRPLVLIETIRDKQWGEFDEFITKYSLDYPVEKVLDLFESRLLATEYYGDSFPRFWPNFGPGIVAAFLGCGVEHRSGTTWFEPLVCRSIAEIHPVFDPENQWWHRVLEVTRSAVKRWGSQVCIGFTDLGGNLDILASLRGTENLLLDLTLEPDQVDRLVNDVTQLWLRFYSELAKEINHSVRGFTCRAPLWFPNDGYILQSDFSYMISPAMFDRFVLPDLSSCSSSLAYPFYHLDGQGQIAHLNGLLRLKQLRGIQWVPGAGQAPPNKWLPLLKRIRDSGELCLVEVDAAGAIEIAEELGGSGLAFQISGNPTEEEAADLIKRLGATC